MTFTGLMNFESWPLFDCLSQCITLPPHVRPFTYKLANPDMPTNCLRASPLCTIHTVRVRV